MRLDRIEKDEEILVDVIESPDQRLQDTSMACRTVDLSENGMKVRAGMEIPVASKLNLRLDLAASLYRLHGEVRWYSGDGDGYLGLMLDEDSPDFINWTRAFELDLVR